jgi:chromosome segregation protein
MNAAKDQAIGAHRLPELRDAEAAAAARLAAPDDRQGADRGRGEQRMRARQAELSAALSQLDADMAREEQMVRDNADMLSAPRGGRETCGRGCRRAGARDFVARAAFEQATATLTLSRGALSKLTSERAEAPPSAPRPSARLREAPSAATGWRGSSPMSTAIWRDRRAAFAALPIRPRSGLLVDAAQQRWPMPKPPLPAEKAVGEARARRNRRPSALAGGAGRTCAHRDRGAHAGEDAERGCPAACSRPCWSRSASIAASRPRWAPRSATTSTRRWTAPRRALGGHRARAGDPALPEGRQPGRRGARAAPACPPSGADRHRRGGDGARCKAARARPAAGQPRRRAVALGWPDRQRRRPDRRGAAAGAEEPAGRTGCRGVVRRPAPLRAAEATLAEAETAVRQRSRPRESRATGVARRAARASARRATRWPRPSAPPANLSSRRAALDEARARLAESHAEASPP